MGDFSRRLGPDGQDQWWLDIVGKGQRARRMAASPELLIELPRRAEATPLVVPFRGARRGLSRSALHDALKRVLNGAALWLRARPPSPIGPTNGCARRRIGCGIPPARIRPTPASICARCATTSGTCRRTLQACTCTKKRKPQR